MTEEQAPAPGLYLDSGEFVPADELGASADIVRVRSALMTAVAEAALVAHGVLFRCRNEPRPDRPALEEIWLAVDALLATTQKAAE